jgi:hypothetical protein
MVRITYTQSLGAKNTHLIEDLLEMVRDGKQGCVDGVIKMIADLHEHGSECRYLKALGGGLLELKTRTPQEPQGFTCSKVLKVNMFCAAPNVNARRRQIPRC